MLKRISNLVYSLFLLLMLINRLYAEDAPILCDVSKGLQLMNQQNTSQEQISRILASCDQVTPNDASVLLLHALFANKQAETTQNYTETISWLEKARAATPYPRNRSAIMLLALVYVKLKDFNKATELYQFILNENPTDRAALLGMALLYRIQHKLNDARLIYNNLLAKYSKDAQALNGLGWIAIEDKNTSQAINYFQETLSYEPQNQEALTALSKIHATESQKISVGRLYEGVHLGIDKVLPVPVAKATPILCDVNHALILLNKPTPPLKQIQFFLRRCDKYQPDDSATYLLHGLLARHNAEKNKDYSLAIYWLLKAVKRAPSNNLNPILELAYTYVLADKPNDAFDIYQFILASNPDNKVALLGEAQILKLRYQLPESLRIYRHLLKIYPKDTDVLSAYGLALLTNYQIKEARAVFNEVLTINPLNAEAITGQKLLADTTKYLLDIRSGYYTVPPEKANALNVYFLENLNATDSLILYATHNSRQIGEDFFSGPTLLPNNSLLLGFQRKIPKKYGWGISYDFRQHDGLPDENRIEGITNLFIFKNVESYSGLRVGFGSPWKNQLLYSGLTLYDTLPINLSFTGFWANQQIGGKSQSYSLDFSKEYSNRLFYSFGPSYSPTLRNWEVHGRIILPFFKNQAFVADFSHYYFNNSTFINAGWRIYWA